MTYVRKLADMIRAQEADPDMDRETEAALSDAAHDAWLAAPDEEAGTGTTWGLEVAQIMLDRDHLRARLEEAADLIRQARRLVMYGVVLMEVAEKHHPDLVAAKDFRRECEANLPAIDNWLKEGRDG
jgi:hypothetical protein